MTEGVRGDGGVLKNSEGKRFMFDYIPGLSRFGTPKPGRRPTSGWDNDSAWRTPDLTPRRGGAAINPR